MDKYISQCDFYLKNPPSKSKFEFHHIYPSFIFREIKGLKNRAKTIDLLDAEYKPKINIVKLPCKWHILIHWNLANALTGTRYEKDAQNALRLMIGDFYTPWEEFKYEQIQNLAKMYEETCQPNRFSTYMTASEKEVYYKQLQKQRNNK